MTIGTLVTYNGPATWLRGRVGVVERVDHSDGMVAVDFGKTDEPIIRCFAHNLIAQTKA